ncbi:hypothetical protein BH11ARM2_BH11ARM2_24320 [soil metagenome]
MKNLIKIAAMAALTLTTVSAMAQITAGGGGGNRQGRGMRGMRGMMMNASSLLQRDDVRDELALTDEQKDKLKDLQTSMQAKMRESFESMRNNGGGGGGNGGGNAMREAMTKMGKEADAEVAKILTPEQNKRLGEIKVQLGGGRVLLEDDVATALNLTADQKTKIKALSDSADQANRSAFQKVRSNDLTMEQAQATMGKNTKTLDDAVMNILTADQKTKLEALKGKKFEEKMPSNSR